MFLIESWRARFSLWWYMRIADFVGRRIERLENLAAKLAAKFGLNLKVFVALFLTGEVIAKLANFYILNLETFVALKLTAYVCIWGYPVSAVWLKHSPSTFRFAFAISAAALILWFLPY